MPRAAAYPPCATVGWRRQETFQNSGRAECVLYQPAVRESAAKRAGYHLRAQGRSLWHTGCSLYHIGAQPLGCPLVLGIAARGHLSHLVNGYASHLLNG